MFKRKFYWVEEGQWISLVVSANGLRTINKLGLDADDIVNMKMEQNEAKYPVEKAKGKADKYNQLQ